MRKSLALLISLFSLSALAQIVTIPDANFKAKLLLASNSNFIAVNLAGQNFKIDANDDGEIQESEALQVSQLYVSGSNISNLTGIAFFTNLQLLNCDANFLTTLDTSSNTNLTTLYCGANQLTSLTVSANNLLNLLHCYSNQLTSLNVSNNPLLTFLNCSSNQLTSLDVSNNTALNALHCGANQLTSLSLVSNSLLTTVDCNVNQLTSLDLTSNPNLTTLYCHSNLLTSLIVNNNSALANFDCKTNQLTNLNVGNNTNLTYLDCSDNQLSNLNLTNNLQLNYLICNNNQLTALNVNNNLQLTNLICSNNQLTSLDVSNNTLLVNIDCASNLLVTLDTSANNVLGSLNCANNLLTNLVIKNGSNHSTYFLNNTLLEFICADESELVYIQELIDNNGLSNTCFVSSYCSFTPEGNYNTITGTVRFDENQNGCDGGDLLKPNIKINITDGNEQGATFTNNVGLYSFYTTTGNYLLSPNVENPSWFTFDPDGATIPFTDDNNNLASQNFCIAPSGIHPDVEVVIAPLLPAQPGFEADYLIVYKNKGNLMLSGEVSFTYDDSVLQFVSATVTPNTQSNGLLNWTYSDLLPFQHRTILVTLGVNSPQDSPAVNLGDLLSFQATITTDFGDDLPNDNLFSYAQTVVGSYDPNDIVCVEGDIVPPSEIGQYLHYLINFENTGTAAAQNVVVKVVVDPDKFDVDSLQLLNTSHQVNSRVKGNKVEFIFQEVWLDTGGHGNVLLKIKSKNNLQQGDTVAKQANIYFDYNFPIETNLANTTFDLLNTGSFERDESIRIAPNPVHSVFHVQGNNTIKTIELYDVQGRLLFTQIVNGYQAVLDVSNQNNGIYFAKITSEEGVKVEKISKE